MENKELDGYLSRLKSRLEYQANDNDVSAEDDAEEIAKEIRKKGIWDQYSPLLREYHNREK